MMEEKGNIETKITFLFPIVQIKSLKTVNIFNFSVEFETDTSIRLPCITSIWKAFIEFNYLLVVVAKKKTNKSI